MNALAIAGAGALLGLLNAAHCAGMCGAFALQAAAGRSWGRTGGFGLYLLGKLCTYLFLGALAGTAGAAALAAAGGWQVALALIGGAALVAAGVTALRGGRPSGRLGAAVARATSPVLGTLLAGARLLEDARSPDGAPSHAGAGRRALGRLLFGAVTGLMPCGLVYLAALQGAALGSAGAGVLFMAGFGVGTGPALAATGLLGQGALARFGPARVRLAGGVLLLVAGLASLARAGMALHDGSLGGAQCPLCWS